MTRGYVLAGGQSKRFGSDKALADLGGKPVLAHLYGLVRNVTSDTIIIGDSSKYARLQIPMVADGWPGEGPLGGILTALNETAKAQPVAPWNLIVSCDMPFLTSTWLNFLMQRAQESTASVVLARSDNGPEPLCACWRTDARTALQGAFDNGVRKVTDALKTVSTEMLDERDWKRFDTAGRLFWNMNTPADYEEARRTWTQG